MKSNKNYLSLIIFFILILFSIFLLISLISYEWIFLFKKEVDYSYHIFGITGFYLSNFFIFLFGILAFLFPAIFTYISYKALFKNKDIILDFLLFLIFVIFLNCIFAFIFNVDITGIVGAKTLNILIKLFNKTGAFFIAFSMVLLSAIIFYLINFPIKKFKQEKIKIRKVKNIDKKPNLSFLKTSSDNEIKNESEEYIVSLKERLTKKFIELNISGEIKNIITGPTVILIEYEPESSIKLSKFNNIEKDIAMALEVENVRILAPIPGKSAIGIEIPRKEREIVYFGDIIKSKEFNNPEYTLPIALGKTIDGKNFIIDLTSLPHLLIGGTTGSGKSICLHCFILSLLFKNSGEDVRFILIDPKMIEFSIYNHLPHLVFPVITEVEKAIESLKWAVDEMEERYKKISKFKKRDFKEYIKIKKEPYIVIIIDELADLMLSSQKSIEPLITRLTQKGRAAGIHLVLATQRPSVDVITGVIKNNLPARISFKVASAYDSRTILDKVGAENLLGKGDMLYLEPGKNLIRLQGAFVSLEEIEKIVKNFIEK